MSFKIKRSSHGNSARSSIRRSLRKKLKQNTHQKLRDPTKFDAPDSDEEAWLDELFIKKAVIVEVTSRIKNNFFRSKEHTYQIHVQWSIGKTTIVYRNYDNFFSMQMKLLDHFGEDPSSPERTIPFLPGRGMWTIETKRWAMRCQSRIQDYIDKLLVLPYKISRCNAVLDFFRYRDSDPKEVMVTVPDDLIFKKPDPGGSFIRASLRRSFRKVKKKMVRTSSLQSMTAEERAREDNTNYDIEPTSTNSISRTRKEGKEREKTKNSKAPGIFSDAL